MKKRKPDWMIAVALAATVALTGGLFAGCTEITSIAASGESAAAVTESAAAAESAAAVSTGSEASVPAVTESAEPIVAAPETTDGTFTFSDSGVSASADIDADSYKIEGTALTISGSGTYTITGSCAEGSVKVKKGTTGVTLILEDLSLACSTTAPLSCNKGTETVVYISGTVTLTDNEDPADEDTEDFEGAAIKVKSENASLLIAGSGTLNIVGNCKNGIKGAATASITVDSGVTLNITAENNGLASDGSVTILGGTLDITAGNDGIKSEPDEDDDASAGTISISGGLITINAQGDGVQATGELTITGGSFAVTTFGGAAGSKSLGDESAKGLKSDSLVTVTGGSFSLNCADDAVHSNGSVSITGGSFTIATGDDGIHADYDVILGAEGADQGPDITITTSYEGIEGGCVILNAGTGDITASDDGVNAASSVSVSEVAVYINGGEWTVNAGGDGIDAGGDSQANWGGSVCINGGTTLVFGAADSGNAALDYDTSCVYTGGTFFTADVSGMNQTPSSGTYVFFGNAAMGGGMGGMGGFGQMGGSSGSDTFSATGVKTASCIMLCAEALTEGETYTLYVDGSQAATATASSGSAMGGFGQMGGPMGQMPGGMGQMNGGELPESAELPEGMELPDFSQGADSGFGGGQMGGQMPGGMGGFGGGHMGGGR